MKLEMTISEVAEIFKEIQQQPEQLFEMPRMDIRETVGQYLTTIMNQELTHFLGRGVYKRSHDQADVNYRNGSYLNLSPLSRQKIGLCQEQIDLWGCGCFLGLLKLPN